MSRGSEFELSDADRTAVHEVELGVEWLRRAHGNLLQFHHAVGHAMDHLAAAEPRLREIGQTALANELRDDHLPSGVDGDRWSYELLETFERGLLTDISRYEQSVLEEVTDGRRHVAERMQETRWKERGHK